MYLIRWLPEAKEQLRSIFQSTDDQAAIHVALNILQFGLISNPLLVGFERDSSVHRMNYERPLFIEYYVIEDDKCVEVLSVHEYHGS